jgi:hypothetical protein
MSIVPLSLGGGGGGGGGIGFCSMLQSFGDSLAKCSCENSVNDIREEDREGKQHD